MHLAQHGPDGGRVAPVHRQERVGDPLAGITQSVVEVQAHPLEHDPPRERVPVGVKTGRGIAQQGVAGADGVAVQRLVLLDHADDGAGQAEGPGAGEAPPLRLRAARDRHPVRAAAAGDAVHDTGDLVQLQPRAGDVVHEGDRDGAMNQDVVDAVVDQIFAHRIVSAGLQRDEDLGADAVGAEHQRGRPHPGRHPYHAPESTDFSDRERRPAARDRLADAVLLRLGPFQVHAGGRVFSGHGSRSASWTWVRSWNALTRRSTSSRVTCSKPRMPNCSTAYEPMAAPYTMARRMLSSPKEPVRARYAMKPPANASPAPVGSYTVSSGKAGT